MENKKQRDEPRIEAFLGYANSIIDTLREPFLVLDKNLRVISTNQAFYSVFEVTEKETIGQPLPDLGNKQWDIPRLLQLLKEIIPEKKVVKNYELEHQFEQIGQRVMILNARQLRIPRQIAAIVSSEVIAEAEGDGDREAGEEELILLAIQDVTERKRIQKELKESEERFRRAFETSLDGLLLVHKTEGKILNSNPSIQKMLDYSSDELLKKKIWEIGVTKDGKDFQETMAILEKDGVIYYNDMQVNTKKGLQVSSDVFLVDKAKVMQCNIRDMTEKKKSQDIVTKLAGAQSKFTSTVSHELRSPLSAIKEATNLVLDGSLGPVNAEQEDVLSIAKENIDRLGRLINNVLVYQKIEAGRMGYDLCENDLNEVVGGAHKSVRLFSGNRKADLIMELGADLPKIKFDKDKIFQVLINLMANAIKYSKSGSIIIQTRREDQGIHVSVQDSGLGIKPEDLEGIFEPFRMLGNKQKDGTGLGLAIAKEIVLAHHGRIWAESEAGKGSTFHFTLPF
jgi:PAS domain S-box-containing protein